MSNKDPGVNNRFIYLEEVGWSLGDAFSSVMEPGPKLPMIPSDEMMHIQDPNGKPHLLIVLIYKLRTVIYC